MTYSFFTVKKIENNRNNVHLYTFERINIIIIIIIIIIISSNGDWDFNICDEEGVKKNVVGDMHYSDISEAEEVESNINSTQQRQERYV